MGRWERGGKEGWLGKGRGRWVDGTGEERMGRELEGGCGKRVDAEGG